MIIFTDDDLKRLKKRLKYVKPSTDNSWLSTNYFLALLARLKAAEAIVERWDSDILVERKLFGAWRKAAGKAERE